MADVQFDEEQVMTRYAAPPQKKGGSLIGLVMKMGLAKDERGAQYVLIAVAVVCFVLMGFVLFSGGSKPARIVPATQGLPGTQPQ